MDQVQLILSPEQSASEEQIKKAVASILHLPSASIHNIRIVKRSIDARQKELKVLLTVQANAEDAPYTLPCYQDVHDAGHQVVIIGAGPAGLFAALTLIEHGIKPIIIERGKEVSARKMDIALLNRNEGLNVESNYCFGEGGAGTFSDGKLFSRSKKRGNMQRVMEIFHYHGATEKVLYEAHAHIGSDKLPTIIRHIRETILNYGGEIYFKEKVTQLILEPVADSHHSLAEHSIAKGVITESGRRFIGDAVILAIGHSAHDTYKMLQEQGVSMEAKGCAIGVRVEHPQSLINRLMYHNQPQAVMDIVGNASYSLVTQVNGRGVYSFCMCPGGHIVPAGSAQESCVVNGMSASHRNSPFANSGIVVEIHPEDLADWKHNPTQLPITLAFQQYVEHLAWQAGGDHSEAPAQRLKDFVEGKESVSLPKSSYLPGMKASRLDQWLPSIIGKRLQQGFKDFNKKYPGYLTNEAVILGVESRSSSAIRISRDHETFQSVSTQRLYPCGEGAGYAGGITSSALDGINAAIAIAKQLNQQ